MTDKDKLAEALDRVDFSIYMMEKGGKCKESDFAGGRKDALFSRHQSQAARGAGEGTCEEQLEANEQHVGDLLDVNAENLKLKAKLEAAEGLREAAYGLLDGRNLGRTIYGWHELQEALAAYDSVEEHE